MVVTISLSFEWLSILIRFSKIRFSFRFFIPEVGVEATISLSNLTDVYSDLSFENHFSSIFCFLC